MTDDVRTDKPDTSVKELQASSGFDAFATRIWSVWNTVPTRYRPNERTRRQAAKRTEKPVARSGVWEPP